MKTAKFIIIFLNIIIIGIAIKWLADKNWQDWHEPAIVIVGQLLSLITLSLDQSKGKTKNTNSKKLTLDVDTVGHADVENDWVEDSNITIKKR